ncbi:MAG TPA: hypothetical protein VKH64_00310, partial [Candidatus Binatia bacterium]|nr:hypothetical protein [Candidatus Binatia bacterium]
MKSGDRIARLAVLVVGALFVLASPRSATPVSPLIPNNLPLQNPTGAHATFSTTGALDLSNEFFQNLGTNGRRCSSCHVPEDGWTITPADVQQRFAKTNGTDPIFRPNDGSNSPNADVSTLEARRTAYSMLLTKGVIRIGIGIPSAGEFDLIAVDNPYGFASAAELSLFRRPLPSTNLGFLSTVMWDGRETFVGQTIHFDLADQANGATQGHAQGNALTQAQRDSIVAFETALFTAQILDNDAGRLDVKGGLGGPQNLSQQDFYIGINDLFGDSKTGAPFDPVVFTIYDAWKNLTGGGQNQARAAVARGQEVFNSKLIQIRGVSGINDEAAFGNPT